MLARIITMRFDRVLDAFNDQPLCDFLKGKHVLSIRDHFFVREDIPYLAAVVTYAMEPPPPPGEALATRATGGGGGRST